MTKYDLNYKDLDNYDFYKTDKGTLLATDKETNYDINEQNFDDLREDENTMIWNRPFLGNGNQKVASFLADRYSILNRKDRLNVLDWLNFDITDIQEDYYNDFEEALYDLFKDMNDKTAINVFEIFDKTDSEYCYGVATEDYDEYLIYIQKRFDLSLNKESIHEGICQDLYDEFVNVYEVQPDGDFYGLQFLDISEEDTEDYMLKEYNAKPVELNVKTTVEF